METVHHLATILADGAVHEQGALAAALGCHSADLGVLLDALGAAGVVMAADASGAVRAERPFEPLCETEIMAALGAARRPPRLEVMGVVGSTNAQLLEADGERYPSGSVVVAEAQSAGRGRNGRRWHSPYGVNVYVSVAFDWRRPLLELQGLTPALGVCIAQGLTGLGARRLSVKWPNDLLHDGRKLAGMLVETVSPTVDHHRIVVGTGVNVGMQATEGQAVDQPWASLHEAVAGDASDGSHTVVSRNAVAGAVIGAVIGGLERYASHGLAAFVADWAALDYYAGRPVSLRSGAAEVRGVARGIDACGRLLLDTPQGQVPVAAGEVSLRGG